MRNKFVVILILMMIIGTANTTYATQNTIDAIFNEIQLYLNGTQIEKETLLYNDTTYIPLRVISEMLNLETSYIHETKSVELNETDKKIEITDTYTRPDIIADELEIMSYVDYANDKMLVDYTNNTRYTITRYVIGLIDERDGAVISFDCGKTNPGQTSERVVGIDLEYETPTDSSYLGNIQKTVYQTLIVYIDENGREARRLTRSATHAIYYKTIDVSFDEIQLYLNNIKVEKETLLYNGTTYVPLRAISEMLNLEIDYDNDTKSVYLRKPMSDETIAMLEEFFKEDNRIIKDKELADKVDKFRIGDVRIGLQRVNVLDYSTVKYLDGRRSTHMKVIYQPNWDESDPYLYNYDWENERGFVVGTVRRDLLLLKILNNSDLTIYGVGYHGIDTRDNSEVVAYKLASGVYLGITPNSNDFGSASEISLPLLKRAQDNSFVSYYDFEYIKPVKYEIIVSEQILPDNVYDIMMESDPNKLKPEFVVIEYDVINNVYNINMNSNIYNESKLYYESYYSNERR